MARTLKTVQKELRAAVAAPEPDEALIRTLSEEEERLRLGEPTVPGGAGITVFEIDAATGEAELIAQQRAEAAAINRTRDFTGGEE